MNILGFCRFFPGRWLALLLFVAAQPLSAAAAELCDIRLHDPEPHILSLARDSVGEGEDCMLSAQPEQRAGSASGHFPLPAHTASMALQFSLNLTELEMESGATVTLVSLARQFDSNDPANSSLMSVGLGNSNVSMSGELHIDVVWPVIGSQATARIALPDGNPVLDIELQWDDMETDPALGLWINGQLHTPIGRIRTQAPRYLVLGLLERTENQAVGGEYTFSQFNLFTE